MTKLNLESLQILDAIDRKGSFALAAEEFCRVPASISYAIKMLEQQLRIKVFSRQGHRAKLTPTGKLLLKEGRALLQAAENVERKIKLQNSGWEDCLVVAYDQIIPFKNLIFLIKDFYKECPGVELKIKSEVLSGCWDVLYSHQAALTIGVTGEFSLREDVSVLPLGEMNFVFVISPQHPLAKLNQSINTETIRKHRIIAVADSARHISIRSSGILPRQEILTVSNFDEKVQALINGLGVGYLPLPQAKPFITSGQLVSKQVKKTPKGLLSTAWRTNTPGLALKWFIDKLSDKAVCKKILSGCASQLN